MNLWNTNNNVSLFITKYLARFRYDKIITDTARIDPSQHDELRKSLIVDPTISNNEQQEIVTGERHESIFEKQNQLASWIYSLFNSWHAIGFGAT